MKNFIKLAFIACLSLVSARVSAQWSLTGNDGVNAATNFVGTLNSADLVFKTNNAERMRINTLGNVGIGTAPSRNLHIRSSNAGIRLEKSSQPLSKSYWDIHVEEGQSGKLHISNFKLMLDQNWNQVPETDTILTFLSSGNVGIGTANPVEALDVNGRIKSAALSTGPWPANASNFVFWGTNVLNQSSSENYALLQGTAGGNLGRTYLNSPLDIRFRIKNTDRMVLAANGNVGIGTVDPQTLLSLGTTVNDRKLALYDDPNSWYGFGIQGSQMKLQVGTSSARFSFLAGNDAEVMTVKGNGNVGIGIASPAQELHVFKSGTNADIRLQTDLSANYLDVFCGNNRAGLWGYEKASLEFATDGKLRMFISGTDGRVGIGTADPIEALDVNGRIKSAALSMGTWPAGSSYVFWGANTLDQISNENYALLQGTAGGNLGRTYLNSPLDIRFRIKNSDKMVLAANGNVGIGTVDPQTLLSLGTTVNDRKLALHDDPNSWYGFGIQGSQMKLQVGTSSARFSFLAGNDAEVMTVKGNGNVGIGTINPQSKLAVNGKITAKEVEVTLNGWADFVFKPDYKLLPLSEVEKFIKEHRHLPGVPSETAVLSKNQNLGEMNALLMQKVEELTLYVIELNKNTEKLERENTILRSLFDKIIK